MSTTTKVINLTNQSIGSFAPMGARQYPIVIIASLNIAEEIESFLKKSSYIQQPDIYAIPKVDSMLPFDWLYFHTGGMSDRKEWLCVSERVYNDTNFRAIILEYLI